MTAQDGVTSAERDVSAHDAIGRAATGTLLLDVREQDEWDRGHSPLATLIPMSRLREELEQLPVSAPILVVCHSGRRSASVAAALREAGYDAVNVVGGMVAVADAGGELVADGPDAPRVD